MINEQKIKRLHQLAERVVDKAVLKETVFSESVGEEYLGANFPRNIVAAITDGPLRGQTFRTVLPISGEMYRDETYRELLLDRCRDTWRRMAVSSLVPMLLLIGPKGRLPQ